MSYEFAKKEIGDYRITVYQDEDAECPCSALDLAGVYLWDYSGCGRGRNVKANRSKTESEIKGYLSIGCAQNALRTSRAAYNTLVNTL